MKRLVMPPSDPDSKNELDSSNGNGATKKPSRNYASITVRVPPGYAEQYVENVKRLHTRFPRVVIRVGGVRSLIVASQTESAELFEVHEWTAEHMPRA